MIDSELKYFDNFIVTLTKYQEQITNHFVGRNNSGCVEWFNNRYARHASIRS